ncbi:hypothetical protein ACK2GQ_22645 [Clostridioides difficile]
MSNKDSVLNITKNGNTMVFESKNKYIENTRQADNEIPYQTVNSIQMEVSKVLHRSLNQY